MQVNFRNVSELYLFFVLPRASSYYLSELCSFPVRAEKKKDLKDSGDGLQGWKNLQAYFLLRSDPGSTDVLIGNIFF